jgi:hypothetical protein
VVRVHEEAGSMKQFWCRIGQRLVVVAAAVATAACGLAGAHASPAPVIAAATSAALRAQAQTELARLLASVRVPPGAKRVATAPIAFLDKPPLTEASPNLMTATAFWRTDESYAATLAWIQAHAPAGLTSNGGGDSGGPGIPANTLIGFTAPATRAYTGAMLVSEVAAIGSGAGIRVDAELIWLPAKPTNEAVPPGTPVTLVVFDHYGWMSDPPSRTKRLDSADADTLIARLNALLPSDGAAHGCAADSGYRVLIDVTVGGVPEVFNDWYACWTVLVTRGGGSLPALATTQDFQNEIDRLVGAPPSP